MRARVAAWFWTGAALTFLILVIGGITRLTQSGLSMVDWEPIVGVIPPLDASDWAAAFERYRQYPEYQQLRPGMTLDEFKFIYFWEYLHRIVARLIGIVFLVPFLWFLWKRHLRGGLMRRALVLFALGGLQGFMGWFMVSSGLADQPHVDHYRLAMHLALAFAIFGCCVSFALDLGDRSPLSLSAIARRRANRWLSAIGVLLILQIVWGALVAGLNAGYIYNTFPLMGGSLVPPTTAAIDSVWVELVENPAMVQWVHRILGTALIIAIAIFSLRLRGRAFRDGRAARLGAALLGLVSVQYLLGVCTLLLRVPLWMGVVHQAMAMVLFGTWLVLMHDFRAAGFRRKIPGLPMEER